MSLTIEATRESSSTQSCNDCAKPWCGPPIGLGGGHSPHKLFGACMSQTFGWVVLVQVLVLVLLVAGCWLLVAGCCLLVAGCWLLVGGWVVGGRW